MAYTYQNSFVAGELSPSLFGRTDIKKYGNGCSTLRNLFVNYQGGASSRAGWAYVGTCKQPATAAPPRDIRFQFNINQGFALEFGDQYMRVKSNGAYVTEATKAITGATVANPAVITAVAHGYSIGDWVYIANMGGMKNFNGLTWIVNTTPTADTFTLKDLFGNVVSSASYSAYTSGGTAARIYTVVAPYAAVDLPYLKYTQSADTMSLTCVNQSTLTEYPAYDLQRLSNTNWVFTATSYASAISAPTSVSVIAQNSTTITTYYSYVITAVNANGEESIASPSGTAQNNNISINAGSNTVTWTPVSGAVSYNIYASIPSYNVAVPIGTSFGYIGTAFGTQFVDNNITADFTKVPPTHNDPFARGQITGVTRTAGGSGLTQASVGYTITTSTGSGFSGTPVIVNGTFTAFVIANTGKNYANGDTIAITTGAVAATGTYTFAANPVDGNTIILNGVTWTFKTTPTTSTQTKIAGTVALTLAQLVADLGASGNASLTSAIYTVASPVVTITYGTLGTVGNAYTLAAGTYGGVVSAATLTGGVNGVASGATATLTIGAATGTYPGVVAYFEQRRGYANTIQQPDTYFFSKPGEYKNMDSSTPTNAGDAIIGTPWAQQINGIQWMIPMPNGLITLTGNGGWLLSGTGSSAFSPSSQQAIQQANVGVSSIVPPILINSDILYIQSKNSVMRDLTYNFFTNIYVGDDRTILANHLFFGQTILQWAYAEEPYKVVWAVRDDGIVLSLTWLKEQDIWGWARHDTDGIVVGVTTVTEPPVDAVYFIVKRYVNGQWMYYSERADNRIWQTVEDSFCVDAGLAYPMTKPNATLTPAAASGTSNISAVAVTLGGHGYTAPVVTASDSSGLGTGATFSVTLSGGVITAVTALTQGTYYTPGTTTLTVSDATGSGAILAPIITNNVVFTASASVFTAGNIGDVIRIGSGKATITGYTSGTQVTANITQNITEVIPDDIAPVAIPAVSGNWTISTPTQTVSGLNHLEGKTVAVVGDGAVIGTQVVTNGAVTLPQPASAITVGLPFLPQLQTMYLDPQLQESAQGKRKNLSSAIVRVYNTRGISVGTNQPDASTQPNGVNVPWQDLIELKQRDALTNARQPVPLFTGDIYVNLPSQWDPHGQVAFQQNYPLPANILAVAISYLMGETA